MNILVLDDGNKGHLNQSLGITNFLPSAKVTTIKVSLKGRRYRLPGRKGSFPISSKIISLFCLMKWWYFVKRMIAIFSATTLPMKGEKYDLVISAGSICAPLNLTMARYHRAKSVTIMSPALLPLSYFDYAIIPYHHFLRLKRFPKNLYHHHTHPKHFPKNIIVTLLSPTPVREESIKEDSKKLAERISKNADLPFVGIIIGGDDHNYRISLEWMKKFVASIFALSDRYRFFLTTSRRTRTHVVQYLRDQVRNCPEILWAEFPGWTPESHYYGILGMSNYLVVTEDSVNMISEAITSGKPTLIAGVPRKKRKKLFFDFTISELIRNNHAEYLPLKDISSIGKTLERMRQRTYTGLNETEKCAQKISESLT